MTTTVDSVAKVHEAIRQAAGERADSILHRRSKYLAELSPHELAQSEPGARIVMKELKNILASAEAARRT